MKSKAIGKQLVGVFIAIIILSIVQGTLSVLNLQKTIIYQKQARSDEMKAAQAKQTTSEVHYSIYKILGTMDPHLMDSFHNEYHLTIKKLTAECIDIGISEKIITDLKNVSF